MRILRVICGESGTVREVAVIFTLHFGLMQKLMPQTSQISEDQRLNAFSTLRDVRGFTRN